MTTAGTVTVDFAAEVAKFNAQLKQVNDRVKAVESGFKSLQKIADTALKFLSVGIAARFIQSAGEAADELGKLSDRLGVSTERLTALQLAANDAGVQTETLTRLLVDSQRRLGDAAKGSGATAEAVQLLGLNVRDLQRLSPDELFLRYAESLEQVKNRSEQFALAQALFGKSAQDAFTLIASGRGAIDQAAATVDRLGLALSRVDIAKIEVANDRMALLARTSQAFGQQAAAALAPFVSDFVERLVATGVSADQARSRLDEFATSAYIAFEISANAARVFDGAISSVVLTLAEANKLILASPAFENLRRGLDLSADLNELVGSDGLAKRFRDFSKSISDAEQFNAALAENAAARIANAAENIKSFAEIFAEAERIRQRATQQAEEAAAAAAANAAALTGEESVIAKVELNYRVEEEITALHYDNMLQLQEDFLRIQAKTTEKLDVERHKEFLQRKIDREKQAEEQILAVKQGAQNAALGLLAVLAQRSKVAAIALIAFEKIRAISQAKINTAVAVTNALASVPYPYNFAAAAQVAAAGNVQIALIAATGLLEAGNVLGSSAPGAPLGSPQNPVFTAGTGGTDSIAGPAGAQQPRQISITFEGVFTKDAARAIAEELRDVIDNSDVHIIGPNSAQARELRGE